MTRHRFPLLAAVAAVFAVAAAAPAQSVTGRWTGLVDVDLRRAADTFVVVRREPFELELQARGDSVVGVAHRGNERWRANVRGTFDGTQLELTATTLEPGYYVDGREVADSIRYTWRGELSGGNLRGTLMMRPTGAAAPPFRWELRRP